ncbi:MAG: DNA methyltransferase [Limisphaerales bacterium]
MKIELSKSVIDAVMTRERVEGAPHDFYRYPARFSPLFAREIIKAYTKPGEVVLDPFCGGGTTLLEAMSQGRRAAGIDVSTLATFIARTKTTPLSSQDSQAIEKWCDLIATETSFYCDGSGRLPEADREHYERNLPKDVRAFFSWVISQLAKLKKSRQQAFIRLNLLSVGQWALDCKTVVPNKIALRDQLLARVRASVGKYLEFLDGAAELNRLPQSRLGSLRRIINRDAREIHMDGRIPNSWLPANLVVTSHRPLYPGVHVVYHRWQINGRKKRPPHSGWQTSETVRENLSMQWADVLNPI